MRTVDLTRLERRLSEYLGLVADGETILVVDQGRVVAELRPPADIAESFVPPSFETMCRQGLVTMPTVERAGPPPRIPVSSRDEVLRDLAESRSER